MAVNTPPPGRAAPPPAQGRGLGTGDGATALALRADGLRLRRWSQAWQQAPVVRELPAEPAPQVAVPCPAQTPAAGGDQRERDDCGTAGGPGDLRVLRELRQRHASHRAALGADADAGLPGGPDAPRVHDAGPDLPAAAQALGATPAVLPAAWPSGAPLAPGLGPGQPAPADAQALHALVEACCARLLVHAPAAGAPAAVLLQLQGSLAGCALEMQRVHGSLRLTLRVAAGERRERLAGGLAGLGDALARTLGCPVVLAVDDAVDDTLGGLPR